MNSFYPLIPLLADERIAERLREACNARRVASSHTIDQGRLTLRRSIGHSMIKLGERLAAEPPLQSARSR
jgi:hypothetical protein